MNRPDTGKISSPSATNKLSGKSTDLSRWPGFRIMVSLITAGLAVLIMLLNFGGCSEDDSCPACPGAPFSITGFTLSPDTVWVGDTLRLWVDVTGSGSGLRSEWFTSTGSFVYEGSGFAMWKAPDTPTIATINVIVYNDDANTQSQVDIPVIPYLPRNEPAYLGGGKCGLTCHGVGNHGSNHDSWVTTPHATTIARLQDNSETEGSCFACHAVGAADVNELGWPLNNGGYDETPIAGLEGVQCESCHGPLADRYGNILSNHSELAEGDFLLDPGTSLAPTGCGKCHDETEDIPNEKATLTEWAGSAHASSHLAEGTDQVECSVCHTAQGFVHRLQTGMPTSMPEGPLPITCAACHDPHEHSATASLRADEKTFCQWCHSDADRNYPEDEPHSPQFQLLTGQGGFFVESQAAENSPHRNIMEKSCLTCHFATDNDQGHTFAADPKSCQACHLNANGSSFSWVSEMSVITSKLAALNAELAQATVEDQATDEYKWAKSNAQFVEADGSKGAHNYLYTLQLLEAAIDGFEPSR